jgi:hypothetical protein
LVSLVSGFATAGDEPTQDQGIHAPLCLSFDDPALATVIVLSFRGSRVAISRKFSLESIYRKVMTHSL